MTDYLSQGVFQPSIPKHLITEEDLKILNAFKLTITPEGENKLFLFADDWCTTGHIENEYGKESELSEDDLYVCLQRIIRRSNGELTWLSKETAYTCTENRAGGFGGSAVFVTTNGVQYFGTSSWLEQRIHEAETGHSTPQTEDPPSTEPVIGLVNEHVFTMEVDVNLFGQNADGPTNEERADRIDTVMQAYCLTLDGRDFDGDEDDVKDLLTDLMHFCARMEIDFEENLHVARDNFKHEREEENDI